jgi:hypothetical protein
MMIFCSYSFMVCYHDLAANVIDDKVVRYYRIRSGLVTGHRNATAKEIQ